MHIRSWHKPTTTIYEEERHGTFFAPLKILKRSLAYPINQLSQISHPYSTQRHGPREITSCQLSLCNRISVQWTICCCMACTFPAAYFQSQSPSLRSGKRLDVGFTIALIETPKYYSPRVRDVMGRLSHCCWAAFDNPQHDDDHHHRLEYLSNDQNSDLFTKSNNLTASP